MKKFIAGIVMTGLMFMALATGALAGGKSDSRDGGSSYGNTNSKYYKGNSSCSFWYYDEELYNC